MKSTKEVDEMNFDEDEDNADDQEEEKEWSQSTVKFTPQN
jgi:hypothetical protein